MTNRSIVSIFAAILAVGSAVSCAQTSYPFARAECGQYSAPVIESCTISFGPDAFAALQDVNIGSSNQSTGYISFSGVEGPGGYVSGAQIDSVAVDGDQITLAFHGSYAPAYGGGPYTGTATFDFSITTIRINRWTMRTAVVLSNGKLTIN